MYNAPQILLCFLAWTRVFIYSAAEEPPNSELVRKFTKNVESVLSPTLIEELQGAYSNRSAVNLEQTVPRNTEKSRSISEKNPEIQFDNTIQPYHYERSYHYHYPARPEDDSSRPVTYTENFYQPNFRPKNELPETHKPSYYRSELYNPFGFSSNRDTNSNQNGNTYASGNVERVDNSHGPHATSGHGSSEVFNGQTPLPPTSFAQPETRTSPPQPNTFPRVDFESYKHGIFGRPLENDNNKNLGNGYLPPGEGKFSESFHQRPTEDYQHWPPLEFQGYNEHRPPPLAESSPHKPQYLPPPPFLGSFFPPGYQNSFHNNYRPSEHFNNLFSENFTKNFPSRPSFDGYYHNNHYLPPPPSPTPALPENKPAVDPLPSASPSSQPIPTTKQNDPLPAPAASNSNYEVKLFFPAKDEIDRTYQSRSSDGSRLQ